MANDMDDENEGGKPIEDDNLLGDADEVSSDDEADEEDDDFGFDDDDFGLGDEGLEDFAPSKESKLGAIFQKYPMAKFGAVGGGVVVLIVLFTLMSGGKEQEQETPSVMPSGREITASPTGGEVTQAMRQAIEETNEQRIDEAILTGESAVPTPIDRPLKDGGDEALGGLDDGILGIGNRAEDKKEEAEKREDPLERWRKLQEERAAREREEQAELLRQQQARQQAQQTQAMTQQQSEMRQQAVEQMKEAMSNQMEFVLEVPTTQVSVGYVSVNTPDYLEALQAEEEERANEAQQRAGGANAIPPRVIFPAGKIAYAQLITEANSDVPGPIVADIASGPLAGGRLLGEFDVQDEYLTLSFSTVVLDGVSYGVNAVAIDPATTLPGMATEVNHRYIQRVFLPMAAAFVEGMSKAIANTGLTTVTIQGETVAEERDEADKDQQVASGIEEAGQEFSDILDEEADKIKVLVRIASGTPMGILFLEPVVEPVENQ